MKYKGPHVENEQDSWKFKFKLSKLLKFYFIFNNENILYFLFYNYYL